MKKCTKCGKDKPLTEFNRDRAKKDGLKTQCNRCRKESNKNYYSTERGKDSMRRAARKYGKTDKGKERHKAYRHSAKGRRSRQRADAKKLKLHPEQRRAATAVMHAVAAGRLSPQPCEVCGLRPAKENGKRIVHAHHDDYSKPLTVRWLCVRHHLSHHGLIA